METTTNKSHGWFRRKLISAGSSLETRNLRIAQTRLKSRIEALRLWLPRTGEHKAANCEPDLNLVLAHTIIDFTVRRCGEVAVACRSGYRRLNFSQSPLEESALPVIRDQG